MVNSQAFQVQCGSFNRIAQNGSFKDIRKLKPEFCNTFVRFSDAMDTVINTYKKIVIKGLKNSKSN